MRLGLIVLIILVAIATILWALIGAVHRKRMKKLRTAKLGEGVASIFRRR